MKHWTSVTNVTKHAGLVADSWRRVLGLKEGFWGNECLHVYWRSVIRDHFVSLQQF